MSLTQLVYCSRNKAAGPERPQLELLRSVLSASQRNNTRDALTGFLLLDRAWFFQILEGERAPLMATYERIQRDPRHTDITLMSMRDIRARSFPRWSMGGVMRNLDQREIFLRHGIGDRIDPSRVMSATILALAMDLQDFEIEQARRGFRAAS